MTHGKPRGWSSTTLLSFAAATFFGLAGCATDPAPAPDARNTEAKLADAVAADRPITDAEVLAAAVDAGYELRYQDGEKVYCRREAVFGTRVKERIVCLTADEIRALSDDARDYMDEMRRRQIPKSGG